ncbi:phage holin family protein [Kribbella pittospori]|uniref:Phage holin family protein n=1 Tax=Kribbella pittospori TaxID=722689 RepID=A0A4R0KAG6_9ACTN|nr:phage holin family protein [Kribbella pittospori]TCC54948.1 phage holin family protein [Kribbella pittospori]
MKLLIRLVVNAIALAVAAWLLSGITIEGTTDTRRVITLLVVAAIFGLVNAFVKPLATLLSLPFIILTLGLLIFVINALMLLLTSWISDGLDLGFHVEGFGTAVVGALIITVVSWLLNVILPDRLETD